MHANVSLDGRDRDVRVSCRLRRSWNDGTHTVVFQPLEFIEKLAALVPPPRAHLLSYHGVFGPNAAWRSEIVPHPTSKQRARRSCCGGSAAPEGKEESGRSQRYTFAELLQRVFEIDVLECPQCITEYI